MSSILNDVKKVIGIDKDYNDFDSDLIMFINSAFFNLRQLGVGPKEGYSISGEKNDWSEFTADESLLTGVKPYIQQKVRLQFDPPTTSFGITSAEKVIDEYEFRLLVASDKGVHEIPDGASAFMWELEAPNQFPPEAEEGDLGIYVPDKSVWRKA